MNLVYAAFRHDPRDPDAASGVDYHALRALEASGARVRVVGPFPQPEPWPERLVRRLERLGGRRPHKFPVTLALEASRATTRAVEETAADAVFTCFPPTLAFYRGRAPAVLRFDTTFLGQQAAWPQFGRLGLAVSVWLERRAFARSRLLVTHSDWSRRVLREEYGIDPERVRVRPVPSALPEGVAPDSLEAALVQGPELPDAPPGLPDARRPWRLLLVGRDRHRKGIDTALATVEHLRGEGIDVRLEICGLPPGERGPERPGVSWVGPFRKGVPEELARYADCYRRAHLLLHPARFEAAGIVPSEAAAFAVPTLTQDVGGLATSVADGESGRVLADGAPAAAWAREVTRLLASPSEYRTLRETTWRRWRRELHWGVTGPWLVEVVREAAARPPEA